MWSGTKNKKYIFYLEICIYFKLFFKIKYYSEMPLKKTNKKLIKIGYFIQFKKMCGRSILSQKYLNDFKRIYKCIRFYVISNVCITLTVEVWKLLWNSTPPRTTTLFIRFTDRTRIFAPPGLIVTFCPHGIPSWNHWRIRPFFRNNLINSISGQTGNLECGKNPSNVLIFGAISSTLLT